ncbi:MAG: malto-oligosyltrehalose synthase [bacterium]|nr:malto-oligosyltrehalose synthase [bacterium]
MTDIRIPGATYRLQFTPRFRFHDALEILPYLAELGISHIYASPVTRARRGSLHGYDVCDPRAVNPELGGPGEFEALLEAVAHKGMGWLQDIVPNHMAYSHENPFLVDVLENGPASRYGGFFDITWDHQYEHLRGRVLAPFLGKPYGQCVVDGDLRLVYENGGLWAAYHDQRYPLSPESYWTVLGVEAEDLPPPPGPGGGALLESLRLLRGPHGEDRPERWGRAKEAVWELHETDGAIRGHVEDRLRRFSTGAAPGNARFDDLMRQQHFRLAFWKVAAEELNYRRFFTISDLICVRVEDEPFFDETHSLVLGLVERGLIGGLRVDHIDGLFDPAAYLRRLRARAPGAYIVVEKILDRDERLPADWPVQGTTGYDFLNHLNYVFCDTAAERRFTALYERTIGRRVDPVELRLEKKRLIIGRHMAGDIDNLAHLIIRIAGIDLMGRDITLYGLRRALVEVLAHFPVYRTYVTPDSFSADDARHAARALALSRRTMPGLAVEFSFIERFLMLRGDTVLRDGFDETWAAAVMRFQQFTGPLMAKGFEDTFFYVYNRHAVLNEVGGWPTHFGIPEGVFHAYIGGRRASHPHGMNATATHDTKRGEDARMRLQVLSEMPLEWARQVSSWQRMNACHAAKGEGRTSPDRNDEYLLYQTLVGTFPPDGAIDGAWVGRIREYMIKAIREAKVHTAWIRPDEEYEGAVSAFVEACLDPSRSRAFTDALRGFAERIAWFGMLNSLSQTALKLTLPGVPDFYQGTELWDFSLVDPDNRRPVDYAARARALSESAERPGMPPIAPDGLVKQMLIRKCLAARRRHERLFREGSYASLKARGVHRHRLLAFTRQFEGASLLVVVPRFPSRLGKANELPTGGAVWRDTRLLLPRSMAGAPMRNICTDETVECGEETPVGDILATFPVAVCLA